MWCCKLHICGQRFGQFMANVLPYTFWYLNIKWFSNYLIWRSRKKADHCFDLKIHTLLGLTDSGLFHWRLLLFVPNLYRGPKSPYPLLHFSKNSGFCKNLCEWNEQISFLLTIGQTNYCTNKTLQPKNKFNSSVYVTQNCWIMYSCDLTCTSSTVLLAVTQTCQSNHLIVIPLNEWFLYSLFI